MLILCLGQLTKWWHEYSEQKFTKVKQKLLIIDVCAGGLRGDFCSKIQPEKGKRNERGSAAFNRLISNSQIHKIES